MRRIVTDVQRTGCMPVGRSSPTKMAESTEMSFEMRTRVGPGNRVLDGAVDPHPW